MLQSCSIILTRFIWVSICLNDSKVLVIQYCITKIVRSPASLNACDVFVKCRNYYILQVNLTKKTDSFSLGDRDRILDQVREETAHVFTVTLALNSSSTLLLICPCVALTLFCTALCPCVCIRGCVSSYLID